MQYALFKAFLDAISTLTSHQKNILNKALSPVVETKTHQPNLSRNFLSIQVALIVKVIS